MDQIKIGAFITMVRKERGMTQKELAELVGVSDKTISKWECGRGLPELSAIMPVCEALHINVNELLSGERLSGNDYQGKAEENMMSLMKESEKSRKKSRWVLVIPLLAVILTATGMVVISIGVDAAAVVSFYDLPTLLIMIVTTVLFLVGTGLGKSFLQSFAIVVNGCGKYEKEKVEKSLLAVSLVEKTWLVTGILSTLFGVMAVAYRFDNMAGGGFALIIDTLLVNFFVAFLGVLYGVLGYLLLIPLKTILKEKECVKSAQKAN